MNTQNPSPDRVQAGLSIADALVIAVDPDEGLIQILQPVKRDAPEAAVMIKLNDSIAKQVADHVKATNNPRPIVSLTLPESARVQKGKDFCYVRGFAITDLEETEKLGLLQINVVQAIFQYGADGTAHLGRIPDRVYAEIEAEARRAQLSIIPPETA